MKTIKELSIDLKISKEAIYKKIKRQLKQELKGHLIKKKNVTYIDDNGIKLIADSLKTDKNSPDTHTPKAEIQPGIEPYKQVESQVENAAYISFLQEQILIKDKQIQRLTELNFELVQTFHQEQKLQAQENLLQLQNSEGTNTKIQNSEPTPKKNFFNIIFKQKHNKNN